MAAGPSSAGFPAADPTVQLCAVGRFRVALAGKVLADADLGSRKARTLLKLLVLERRHLVPTARIVDVLWGADPPGDPAANVATLVSRLRAVLGAGLISGRRDAYGLAAAGGWVLDLDEAARLVTEAEARAAADTPALALVAAQRAEQVLSAGEVLEDEPDAEWAEPARHERADLVRRARTAASGAALRVGDLQAAVAHAADVAEADPLDEPAHRELMRALHAADRPARALAVYVRLADALATELGVDPDPRTRALHEAILRESVPPPEPPGASAGTRHDTRHGTATLVGRDREVARLTAVRESVGAGPSRALVLVTGEAGIGKTRLAAEATSLARRTGGFVLEARCRAAERSLFLQPVIDALRPMLVTLPPAEVWTLAGDHADALAELIPDLAALVPKSTRRAADPAGAEPADMPRRRAFDAVAAVLARLGRERPTVLLLADLHNAGLATIDLLAHLFRGGEVGRLLLLATLRSEEGAHALARLAPDADRIELGPLPASAVSTLAASAGHGDLAGSLNDRTNGHTLAVVEMLRALAAGESGIPSSLAAAVLARVGRAGPRARETLRAAAVLGTVVDPDLLAGVLDESPADALRRCEALLDVRLLSPAGAAFEFVNDLVQEIVYADTPAPVRLAYHRRAASLLTDRPESMAEHAEAVADWGRAGRGWLLAADHAAQRAAATDAEQLLGRALDAADRAGDLELAAQARLARAAAEEALTAYDDAWSDLEAAFALAQETGDAGWKCGCGEPSAVTSPWPGANTSRSACRTCGPVCGWRRRSATGPRRPTCWPAWRSSRPTGSRSSPRSSTAGGRWPRAGRRDGSRRSRWHWTDSRRRWPTSATSRS